MNPLYYFDKISNGLAVVPVSALSYAPDIRGYSDDKSVQISFSNGRTGIANVGDLRAALGSTRFRTVGAQAGFTMHALDIEGNPHERNVIAWNIPVLPNGEGRYGKPVPDYEMPENILGYYGGDFVCVERPDGTCISEAHEWKSFSEWLKTAKAKLKKRIAL